MAGWLRLAASGSGRNGTGQKWRGDGDGGGRKEAAADTRPKLDWVFTRRGESPQGNTSKEETATTGVDVTDPQRPGRAFVQDSLKKCRTSKKLEQEC
uniref:Uncharacterized protein n=1 Tax=Oryza glumipatula TaxID=40148 RepID=A0A0D9ZYJ8_9ORYZ